MICQLLFVYGTLMRGRSNHHLMRSARFVGVDRTLPRYYLYDLGEYPGLVAPGAHAVLGELFEVTPDLLSELDCFEGHPQLFERSEIQLASGSYAHCYLYRGAIPNTARLAFAPE